MSHIANNNIKNNLTSTSFWKKFWAAKPSLRKIGHDYYLSDLLLEVRNKCNGNRFIELGGFPGCYSIFAKKYMNMEPTLLDNYINKQFLNKLLKFNQLKSGDIDVLKKDIFKYKPTRKYDMVFSFGLIEHFENLDEIIGKHISFLSSGGYAVIGVPNFLGLNGLFQKIFDPENLSIHNLNAMKTKNLSKIVSCRKDILSLNIFYYGGLMVWLERISERTFPLRLTIYIINILGLFFKLFNINNKFISPYIFLIIHKK